SVGERRAHLRSRKNARRPERQPSAGARGRGERRFGAPGGRARRRPTRLAGHPAVDRRSGCVPSGPDDPRGRRCGRRDRSHPLCVLGEVAPLGLQRAEPGFAAAPEQFLGFGATVLAVRSVTAALGKARSLAVAAAAGIVVFVPVIAITLGGNGVLRTVASALL